MTRQDVIASLKILKVAYPGFYSKMTAKNGADTIMVWCELFKDEDVNVVKIALFKIIEEHDGYPPTIADIKNKIKKLRCAATGEKTDEELWLLLKTACQNGLYGARQEYEKLPSVVQKYLGSPQALRDLATVPTDTLDTVTHGQFLKQIGGIREREEFDKNTPEEVKAVLRGAYKPLENHTLDEADFNDSRNRLLEKLEQ